MDMAISCQFIQIFDLLNSHQLAHTVRQSVSKSVTNLSFTESFTDGSQSFRHIASQLSVHSHSQSLSQEVRQSGTWSCTQSVIL